MNGLELCRQYWENVGKPAFAAACPEVLERAAVGLVGEGSECFGFDDEISRDHDWGPGFCVWLTPEDFHAFEHRHRSLPGDRAAQIILFGASTPRCRRNFWASAVCGWGRRRRTGWAYSPSGSSTPATSALTVRLTPSGNGA